MAALPPSPARLDAGHRLVWSLFADTPERRRDFLWREDGGNTWQRTSFLILSQRPPRDANGLFEIETKPFSPVIEVGQRLGFRLRASPSASEPRPGERRGKRIDPLAKALKRYAGEERTRQRDAVTQEVGTAWLARQGAGAGFHVAEENGRPLVRVDGDHWRVIRRGSETKPVQFSTFDFEGILVVENSPRFLSALAVGFGRAKAFGCGLMLIRRA